jgi:hypothetical protein
MIPPEQIEKMKEMYIGKKITFKDGKNETWVGTCEFFGYNPHLPSWGLQITINRTPTQNVKPETIKLV